ncbi:MAG: exodeoxyribonuclease III [Chloroflexi bacterium]|nr:exodeoxyribonuclease III [Chloroflexota bacterium]
MKLYNWNVNGIRAAQKKGFLDWFAAVDADIVCLQETKASPDQLDDELRQPVGYYSFWAVAEKKGYSGVVLYSKLEPNNVQIGLGIAEYDSEGRTIVAEYDDFVLLTAYFPNGSRDHSRVPFKLAYYDAFLAYCNDVRGTGKSVIFCGDVNTAHKEIDLARPKENRKTTGFLPEECAWLDQVVEQGYIDIFRDLNPGLESVYTWWPYWSNSRERNVGWRIDYFFITPDLRERVVTTEIHMDVMGSDHCPISLTLA